MKLILATFLLFSATAYEGVEEASATSEKLNLTKVLDIGELGSGFVRFENDEVICYILNGDSKAQISCKFKKVLYVR
jgi:hypothetical protein